LTYSESIFRTDSVAGTDVINLYFWLFAVQGHNMPMISVWMNFQAANFTLNFFGFHCHSTGY